LATAIADKLDAGSVAGRPWRAASLWLLALSAFFFFSYGFANTMASRRAYVPFVEFGWEHKVPFIAWTIIPYWTSDFLYAASLLVCTTRRELNMHACRLLSRLAAAMRLRATAYAGVLRLVVRCPLRLR
jgi:hypothetical protein